MEAIAYAVASLSDFNAYIDANRRAIDGMIHLLTTYFDPKSPEVGSPFG